MSNTLSGSDHISLLYRQQSIRASADIARKISVGQRIARASDDLTGFMVSRQLSSDLVSINARQDLNDKRLSLLSTVDSAYATALSQLQSMKTLATSASSTAISQSQRNTLISQFNQLREQLDIGLQSTRFNNQTIFNTLGSATAPSLGAVTSYNITQDTSSADSALADFNGDGIMDMIIAGGSDLQYVVGTESGFDTSNVTEITFTNTPGQITKGDFNGDGYIDFAVSRTDVATQVEIYTNNGSGGFTKTGTLDTTDFVTSANELVAADLNNDGVDDLIMTTGTGAIRAFTNDGNGSAFTSALVEDEGTATQRKGLAVADFDNDGDMDIVTTRNDGLGNSAIDFYANDSEGSFAAPLTAVIGTNNLSTLAFGDLNNDGNLDLAVSNGTDVNIYDGDGTGLFGVGSTIAAGAGTIAQIAIGDYTRDGNLDVIIVGGNANDTIFVAEGDGIGGFDDTDVSDTGVDIAANSVHLADIGSVTGAVDIVITATDVSNNRITIQHVNNSSSFSTAATIDTTSIGVNVNQTTSAATFSQSLATASLSNAALADISTEIIDDAIANLTTQRATITRQTTSYTAADTQLETRKETVQSQYDALVLLDATQAALDKAALDTHSLAIASIVNAATAQRSALFQLLGWLPASTR